jgi:thiamine-phosphate pyrophosphorylase
LKLSDEEVAKALRLCAVTDRKWIEAAAYTDAGAANDFTLEQQVAEAIAGGATMIQLREKKLDDDSFLALASRVREVTSRQGIPLVINDNLGVALAIDADGLHIGQDDGDQAKTRKALEQDKFLGVSVHCAEEAIEAEKNGADYIGIGAVFPTGSKDDVSVLPLETVKAICASVRIPTIAIGGINADNAHLLSGTGIAGIAVISAIFSRPERVKEEAARLSALAEDICKK